MSETTQEERALLREHANPDTELGWATHYAVNDADRLAAIEAELRALAERYAEDIGDADNLTIARELRAILDPEGSW